MFGSLMRFKGYSQEYPQRNPLVKLGIISGRKKHKNTSSRQTNQIPCKSKTKQRMVFRMIHIKDSLLPMGKVWSLDSLGIRKIMAGVSSPCLAFLFPFPVLEFFGNGEHDGNQNDGEPQFLQSLAPQAYLH